MKFLCAALAIVASLGATAGVSAATIEISNSKRMLTLHQDNGELRHYQVAVGLPRAQWTGTQTVSRKAEWPDWRPTANARRHHPRLPALVKGGPGNPLGARALYLGSTLYRIHGTNTPDSIGKAASSGCFRMRNEDVIDLYARVPVGTRVTVTK